MKNLLTEFEKLKGKVCQLEKLIPSPNPNFRILEVEENSEVLITKDDGIILVMLLGAGAELKLPLPTEVEGKVFTIYFNSYIDLNNPEVMVVTPDIYVYNIGDEQWEAKNQVELTGGGYHGPLTIVANEGRWVALATSLLG
jgi:hypothetical protein